MWAPFEATYETLQFQHVTLSRTLNYHFVERLFVTSLKKHLDDHVDNGQFKLMKIRFIRLLCRSISRINFKGCYNNKSHNYFDIIAIPVKHFVPILYDLHSDSANCAVQI